MLPEKKIGIISLGCARNLVDSELLLGQLDRKGYKIVDIDKADTGIVNTCSFINDAKKQSIDVILDLIQLKKSGKIKKIIVCGCLAQRYKEKLQKELPEVDAFIGSFDLSAQNKRYPLTANHLAYLKICEGCFNSCSFCIIPKIKGRLKSLPLETLIKQAKLFDKQGVRELNIIGQDISSYGRDLYGQSRLSLLVKKILENTRNIDWVRLLYLYPDIKVINDLLEIMRYNRRLLKYIDLPLQHISDRILKLMRRSVSQNNIRQIIGAIRGKIPQAAIRTAFIVGFPQETDRDFKQLLNFVKEVKFERLGVFIYSPEEGTPAFKMKNQVPEKVKQERFDQIMQLQQQISTGVNLRMMGQVVDVLIEEEENGVYIGRSQHDAPEVDGNVFVKFKRKLLAGDLVRVKITDTMEYDLVGEAI
ncbi:MAG: 30S ribosomal protein S12 methylthiotransferase RimO [Candidatus Omnitrophica bacterium]|jgi:ribosomal protein S12 methylthiotransferase|nr:30S ribosomal protein S12 methylthiotransferase RimO [Candidatus Omnitrophota bacterium]